MDNFLQTSTEARQLTIMGFVQATQIVFLPCKFFGILLVNLKNPKNDSHSKSLLFWKLKGILIMLVSMGFFLRNLFYFPLVTLKDLVELGQYLSFIFVSWSIFHVTMCRSQASKQLYIKFYDLSEHSFYSETNFRSVSVFCKFLTFLAFLIQIELIYLMLPYFVNTELFQLLTILFSLWITNVHVYYTYLIIAYIFLLSLYLSEINKFLNNNFIHRKLLRTLINIYTKIFKLSDDLISIFDIYLLLLLIGNFFWIMWIMYSKIYIWVEMGFISPIEIFDFIKSIFLSSVSIGVLLWICSKTKNMVSFNWILSLFKYKMVRSPLI